MATGALPPAGGTLIGAHSAIGRATDLVLPVGLVASVLVILVPMPTGMMDLLLSLNIGVAVVMLLTAVYVKTPLEFSVFPSLLLATTLARLVLNVATTRLILTRGQTHGLLAAGGVVRSFGEFVAGDKVAVGLVIFAILVVIQFVVITKGATRISEVAARFALDGMPGRQMAVDADVQAGAIDDTEARRRRSEISQQADFYGAMDGASKFVRGDAIAGVVIIAVNIIGGLFIGVFDAGMSVGQAAHVFTKLTIGDGLVSQVPAFLISLAAGLLVTRGTRESNLPADLVSQLCSRPQAMLVTAAFLGMLAFTGLPMLPLLGIGAACVAVAVTITRKQQAQPAAAAKAAAPAKSTDDRIENYLLVDPIELELGVGLIRLADAKRGGDLLERVGRVRQAVAHDLGIIMPKVRIRDNTRLEPKMYRIKLADNPVAEGLLGDGDSAAIVIDHLTRVVRRHADELLTRDAAKHLVDELRQRSPAVVDELIPGLMKLADVQQVLQMLLREGVPIRPLGPILESLGQHATTTTDLAALVELVRQSLARTLCSRWRDSAGRLRVVTLDPTMETSLRQPARLSPADAEALCESIAAEVEPLGRERRPAVVLVSPSIRSALKVVTQSRLPDLVVLSYQEITRDTLVESIAVASTLQPLAPSP